MMTPLPSNPTPVHLRGIPDGYGGTVAVVREMITQALAAYPDERVNRLAREVTIGCAPRDTACEASVLLKYMQQNFRYTNLPFPDGLQRLQTPSETLFDAPIRSGECASLSCALAALQLSLGHVIRFRVGGRDASQPKSFEHVWLMTEIPGHGWVASDPSYQHPLGWQHPAVVTVEDFDVQGMV